MVSYIFQGVLVISAYNKKSVYSMERKVSLVYKEYKKTVAEVERNARNLDKASSRARKAEERLIQVTEKVDPEILSYSPSGESDTLELVAQRTKEIRQTLKRMDLPESILDDTAR